VVGGFVSAFGFGGAIAAGTGLSDAAAVLVGVVAGVAFGWFAAWLTRVVRGGGSDDVVHPTDAIGHQATVLTDIPEDGFGVVRVRIGGHVLQFNARCEGRLAAGAEVYVTGVLSPTAVTVAPTWSELI
jgi:membrane protein implicated in regulation of membrane protease activity